MNLNVNQLLQELASALQTASSLQAAIEVKNKWFKIHVIALQNQLKDQSLTIKRSLGQQLHVLKLEAENLFEVVKKKFEQQAYVQLSYDSSLANHALFQPNEHWLNKVISLACDWFVHMNFQIEQGNEIVSHHENFDLLNIKPFHPARLKLDSFYFNDQLMLRAHNTSNTAKVLLKANPKQELRVATFGNVFRNDQDDATHSHQFMQIDFIWIKPQISLLNLKWVINSFLSHVFECDLKTRFRPSYFPFTEPSFEVDVACFHCAQKGCFVCKQTGWIEILGSGMIHNNVLQQTGYDPNQFSAIAAGIGCERLAMIKYGVSDLRSFYANDQRFFKKN